MGRRWKKKRKDRGDGQKPGKFYDRTNRDQSGYTPQWQTNRRLEAYYAYQGLHNHYYDETSKSFRVCETDHEKEQERQKWMHTLKCILPASFRLGTDVDPILRDRLERELDEFVGKEMEITIDPKGGRRGPDNEAAAAAATKNDNGESKSQNEKTEGNNADATEKNDDNNNNNNNNDDMLVKKKLAPARKIPYIPHAYQLSIDRRTIRRNPGLEGFHEWLKVQTEAGFLTRQETVSMIPPIVLSVEPHHQVLDMCAAPGSKTSQILEIVSQTPSSQQDQPVEPTGCVVANDSDPKRAYMLVHQLKRINSPVAFVTSCDAQFFPLLKDKTDVQEGREGMFDRGMLFCEKKKIFSQQQQIRGSFSSFKCVSLLCVSVVSVGWCAMTTTVLSDVPCSGDGTMRKNPGVWKFWNAIGGLSLHPLQLAITLNGARLTKVGGYLCYSTCSQNPIENEAVVAELLRVTDGSLELVDKRPDMEGLLARPGWTTWRVLTENRSKRDAKNKNNKNNKKMQQRRRDWAKHKKRVWDETKGEEEENPQAKEEEAPKEEEKEKEEQEDKKAADGDNGEAENEPEKPFVPLGPPASWDEDALRNRALAEGLIEYKSYDEVVEKHRRRVRKSCFPPTKEEVSSMGLEKCLRCLPQDMDTGGFFVALFRKVKPLSKKARERSQKLAEEFRGDVARAQEDDSHVAKKMKVDDEPAKATEKKDEGTDEKPGDADATKADADSGAMDIDKEGKDKEAETKVLFRGKGKNRGDLGNENFIVNDDKIWAPLIEYYGFGKDFPRERFMSRSTGESKVMYFIGAPVKALMDKGLQDRITVINAGLKAFSRNADAEIVRYRICQEAIQFIAPYMDDRRKMSCDLDDFEKCLGEGAIKLNTLSTPLAEAIEKLQMGAFVLALRGYEGDVVKKMILVLWRCRGPSVNCLVSKIEKDGIRSKLRAYREEEAKLSKTETATTTN